MCKRFLEEASKTVSNASIIAMVVTLVLSIGFPVALAVWFYRKHRYAASALVTGVAMMAVSQFMIRIPLLQVYSRSPWFESLAANLAAYSLFLGLTAGLFEGVARYVGFRFFLRNRLEWKNAIAYGIGHGGIESILLVGLAYTNNLVISMMINAGIFDSKIAPVVGPDLAQQIKTSLTATAPAVFLLAGVERVLAMVIQIALALVVFYAVVRKKPIYLLCAILLHTLVDTPAALMGMSGVSLAVVELYVLVLAVAAFMLISRSRCAFEEGEPGTPDPDLQ